MKIAKVTGQSGLRKGFGRKKALQQIFSNPQWNKNKLQAIQQIDDTLESLWKQEAIDLLDNPTLKGEVVSELYTFFGEETSSHHNAIENFMEELSKFKAAGGEDFNPEMLSIGTFIGGNDFLGVKFISFDPNELGNEFEHIVNMIMNVQSGRNGDSTVFQLLDAVGVHRFDYDGSSKFDVAPYYEMVRNELLS